MCVWRWDAGSEGGASPRKKGNMTKRRGGKGAFSVTVKCLATCGGRREEMLAGSSGSKRTKKTLNYKVIYIYIHLFRGRRKV